MFPGGMNPKNMGRMMKQFGIKNEELDAESVEIKLKNGKKITFQEPSVQLMEVQGQKTYTIMGATKEESEIPADDIKMVCEQTNCSPSEAKAALEETNGDIAEAIMKLKKE